MDPQQPHPTPATGKRAALLLFAGLALLAVVISLVADGPQPGAPPAASAAPVRQRLGGVAVYMARVGFAVCTRTPLHACRIRYGYRTRTVQFAPVNFGAVASCDRITAAALEACMDGGDVLSEPATSAVRRCLSERGFMPWGDAVTADVDPRDEHLTLPPGRFRMECAEGYRDGEFDEEN